MSRVRILALKKNGHIHPRKQHHQCQACGRQFVLHAGTRVLHEEQRTLVERWLRENISLHGICRAVGVSIWWLMDVMVARFEAVPEHLHVQPIASPREVIMGRLEAAADELWNVVKQKTNKQWIWMAIDQQTRQLIAFHKGGSGDVANSQKITALSGMGSFPGGGLCHDRSCI